ncbi:DUF2922 domain-containing protein [Desulfosporosinus lacus]|uniref:Uncharacterized protein n=1 Tax=Desulfosporosinus lacus DSM 15449 TaxID=1121420 RepID=A0A1M5VLR9_9FIRM|nr:DUF2922 domain-containing protein [Desulfosporosinus lacus]MDA8228523.1 DUF2922 domain-containing protein [Desulfitobacterium hafniense]SHH76181.1 hypothetical protein SAMN02746098_01401 [Desulfosporosinus lacus DSM 15449]
MKHKKDANDNSKGRFDQIIAKNIFLTSGRELVSILSPCGSRSGE